MISLELWKRLERLKNGAPKSSISVHKKTANSHDQIGLVFKQDQDIKKQINGNYSMINFEIGDNINQYYSNSPPLQHCS